nr:hypothetical protein GCM10020093_039950 [Planobispora longispora]
MLGGITVILYGMIGLLGAKIWIENRVDFADPVNMVPVGAGIILAIGPVEQVISEDFRISGIALGTIVVLGGYHLLRAIADRRGTGVGDDGGPRGRRRIPNGPSIPVGRPPGEATPFDYHRPSSLGEALDVLAGTGRTARSSRAARA